MYIYIYMYIKKRLGKNILFKILLNRCVYKKKEESSKKK